MLTICSECTSIKNEWIWVKWPVWISLNRKQNSSDKTAGTTKLMPRSVSLLPLSFCRLTHLCGFWLEASFQSHAFSILIGRINFLHVSKTSIASLVAFSICTSAIIHLVCPPKLCISFIFVFEMVPRGCKIFGWGKQGVLWEINVQMVNRTHLHTEIYDLAFQWVYLSVYIINLAIKLL